MMFYNPKVDLFNDNVYLNSVHSFLRYGAKTKFLNQSRAVNLLQICEKQRFTIETLILSMMMSVQDLVSLCQFVIKTLSKNQILTSIKGRKHIATLRKTMIYIINVDLVNENELHKVWSHLVNSFSIY